MKNQLLQRINQEADSIQGMLNTRITLDDLNILPERLSNLDAALARTGELESLATSLKEKAKALLMQENENLLASLSATASNRMISCALHEYTITEDRLSKLYQTLSQACRNIITQISFAKSQMNII